MENLKTKRKKFKLPSSYTILFSILVIIMLISWVLKFANVDYTNSEGERVYIRAVGIIDLFVSPFQGFKDKSEIIVFMMIIGSFIFVVMKSKSLDAFTQSVARKMGTKAIWSIPPIVIFLSFAGSSYGMAEESLGFHMIVIPLMLAAGFDKMTAIMVVLLGAAIGPLAATFDPFLVIAAMEQSGSNNITITDGLIWRVVSFVLFTSITIVFLMMYASKVKKTPSKSVTFSTLEEDKKFFLKEQVEEIPLTKKRIAIITMFFLAFIIMILYLVAWDKLFPDALPMQRAEEWTHKYLFILLSWTTLSDPGMIQVSAVFLIFTLIIGFMNWAGEENFVSDLIEGSKELLGVAFIVSLAGAITVLFQMTYIQGALSVMLGGISSMNSFAFILLSYFIFLPISFIIPSTSGFASAIFPIWGPTSDSISVSGSSMLSGSITSFAYANGLLNAISPASGIMVGALQIGKTDYKTLMKAAWPFYLTVFLTSIAMLVMGTAMNYTGAHIF